MYNFFQRIRYFWVCLFFIYTGSLFAQAPLGRDALWADLEEQIQKGNRRALRDLATFLDKPNYAEATRLALMRYSFFTCKEIDLSLASREEFLQFYYQQEKYLKFSEILKAFYLTPIENQTLDTTAVRANLLNNKNFATPSVKLDFLSQKFDSLCQIKSHTIDVESVIDEISALKTSESYSWLRRTLISEPFGQTNSNAYLGLCEGLKSDPNMENFQAVLNATERGLVRQELMSPVFLEFTNVVVSAAEARFLLDSLGNLAAIRAYGYDRSLKFRESFFYEKVDYLGKILSTQNAPHWIKRNALHDLLETHHARLLFYLAAQIRLKPDEKEDYIKLLQNLTNTVLILPENPNGNSEEEMEKWKNFVHWWAIHAEDFEWDNTTQRFLSRSEMASQTESIEHLMRRLGSPNDSVAMASFKQLSESDPTIVAKAMEKFRPILRSYNAHLPEINYPFLENISLLTSYCHAHKISLIFSPKLHSLWSKLFMSAEPKERYSLENQFIEALSIEEVTALEYHGLLYSTDLDINFSVSHILDIFYSKIWDKLIADNAALRLYLKKMFWFERLSIGGASSLYKRKIDVNDKALHDKLERILRVESDTAMQYQILEWLTSTNAQKNETFSEAKKEDENNETIEAKIERLDLSPQIQIEELNDFVSHSDFSDRYKPKLIQFLKKIDPLSSMKHFKLKNYLTVKEDLIGFTDKRISHKDLDDFLNIFKIDMTAEILTQETILKTFICSQIKYYSLIERAQFWNSMFKVPWFTDVIYGDILKSSDRDSIVLVLRNYLTSSELLTDFEEQTTQIHIVELNNIRQNLQQKLTSVLQLEATNSIKVAVQTSILARVSYNDIGVVASLAENLNHSLENEPPLNFLQTDFGLPIFASDKATLNELIENHKTLSPKAFYSFYLKQFGLHLWLTEGVLNYEKIYDILSYESVIPFTGGGMQRDYFTFGVIKLLEFEFGTRLGFHEKLNENQTFYTYNTSKRAAAWRQFLVEKKLVKVAPFVSPSFKS